MPFVVEHKAEIPENTLLRAKLADLQVVERGPFTNRTTGEQFTSTRLAWTFEITQQGEFFGMTVKTETEAKFEDTSYNKPRIWSEALLGRPLPIGIAINESDLIGLPALITIGYEPDRKDPAKKWRRVEDVIPVATDDTPPF